MMMGRGVEQGRLLLHLHLENMQMKTLLTFQTKKEKNDMLILVSLIFGSFYMARNVRQSHYIHSFIPGRFLNRL